MIRHLTNVVAAGMLILTIAPAALTEPLDRIAVTIGKHVIAESEVLLELRVDAFLDGQTPDLSGPAKRKAAERMVDQYLVLDDAASTRAPLPGPADVPTVLDPVKRRFGSDEEFKAALNRAGITEAQLSDHLLAGLREYRYTEIRFRPEVSISTQDIRDYYDALPANSRQVASFEQSRNEIEDLLTEERVLQALDRWLGMARTDHQILYRAAAFQ